MIQLQEYLTKNNLHSSTQSAYRPGYSTETALLKVHNDVLRAVDDHRQVVLVLLDLSAAFDTIDHQILRQRLQLRFCVSGTVLRWFSAYLKDRSQTVSINNVDSDQHKIMWGVPPRISLWCAAVYVVYDPNK